MKTDAMMVADALAAGLGLDAIPLTRGRATGRAPLAVAAPAVHRVTECAVAVVPLIPVHSSVSGHSTPKQPRERGTTRAVLLRT